MHMQWSDHSVLSRCIQRADQPIILTGYAALNKLLGREVYTSHMQLGGPKVRNKCLPDGRVALSRQIAVRSVMEAVTLVVRGTRT